MFSFVYEDISTLTSISDPRLFGASGYYGPLALLDDIDHDGIRDVLMGNGGTYTAGRSTGYHRGAAVFSGRTGSLIREHNEPGNFTDGFGWVIANVGDVSGDTVADYAVSTGGYLYSGATGQVLRRYEGGTIVSAGDFDNDSNPDLLVVYNTPNRAVVYRGMSDEILREFDIGDAPGEPFFRVPAAAATDLNLDGVPDAIIEVAFAAASPFGATHLYAYSGADGSLLWDIPNPGAPRSFFISAIGSIDNLLPDLTGDNIPDLAVTSDNGHLIIVSGADGSSARDWTIAQDSPLGRNVAVYGDLDQDGVADLAVGASNFGNGGRIFVVSGADGSVLSTLGFFGELPPNENGGPSGSFGGNILVGDFDGDGSNDILGTFQRFGGYFQPGFSRSYVFSGPQIGGTVISGTTTGQVSRSIMWGLAAQRAFIVRDDVVHYLTGRPQWSFGDVIIDVYESADELIILGATQANGTAPFVWIANHDLTTIRRVDLVRPGAPPEPPNPPVLDDYGIAVAGHYVLFNRVINSTSPSAYIFDIDTEEFRFIMDGRGVDIALTPTVLGPELKVLIEGNSNDGPTSIVWRELTASPIPTINIFQGRPLALSRNGEFGISVSSGTSGNVPRRFHVSPNGTEEITLPLLTIGEDFAPTGVNDYGDVAGTYIVTTTRQRSAFYFVNRAQRMFDLRSGDIFGDPDGFGSTSITKVMGATNAGDVLVSWGSRFSLLTLATDAAIEGPNRAAGDASIAISFTTFGAVYVVTRNAAGEVLHFTRGSSGWNGIDFAERDIFTGLQDRQILTWYDAGKANPTIVLARPEGVLLFEPGTEVGGGWTIRNLTTEIGAEAILDGLITFVPHSGLRIVAGLNSDGELMMYGQTVNTRPDGSQAWAFDNLFDSVVYPTDTPPPRFREFTGVANLVGYVTNWGGQNIAGVAGGGQIVVFWTSPEIVGWRITNLAQVADGENTAESYFRSLHVELTPWNGINLYGESYIGGRVNAVWWVPQFGGRWRKEFLINGTTSGFTATGETMTAYATPWGGLNVARIASDGQIEVYWWSPAANRWTMELLNPQVSSYLRDFRAVGRLASAVSPLGEINIFARNELGDLFRFYWDPEHPWQLERI